MNHQKKRDRSRDWTKTDSKILARQLKKYLEISELGYQITSSYEYRKPSSRLLNRRITRMNKISKSVNFLISQIENDLK